MRRWLLALLAAAIPTTAQGDVIARAVEYRHGSAGYDGTVYYDAAGPAKRPGVLIAHSDTTQAKQRAAEWARHGFVALALDLYGKGVRPKSAADAIQLAGLNGQDRATIRERLQAGHAALKRVQQVDPERVVAVGYGLGGTAVLELARGGADLDGVVALHCDLTTPSPGDAKNIKAHVLVIVGTDDPKVPPAQVSAFDQEMRGGGVDWQVLRIGGAVHDFTDLHAGRDLRTGRAYDPQADRRAAAAARAFLDDLVARTTAAPKSDTVTLPPGVPAKVATVLAHVDKTGEAPDGYEGGRNFGNFERLLPERDARGRGIRYREWDVNPLRPGVNRGAERMVTGSDGSAHYTSDHYKSFKKIR